MPCAPVILRYFIVTMAVMLSELSLAQTKEQRIKFGDLSYNENDFYGASIYYANALGMDSSDLQVYNKYAESLRLTNDYKKAAIYYNNLLRRDRARKFPETRFWLAMMQKSNGDYLNAQDNFQQFAKGYRNKKSYIYLKATQEVESCAYAIELMKDTVSAIVENAGNRINTTDSEFGLLLLNDSVLYFTGLREDEVKEGHEVKKKKYYFRILQAENQNGQWVRAKELPESVNLPKQHIANGTFGTFGNRFYFSVCNDALHCNIYYAEKTADGYSSARSLSELNLEGYVSTHPHITYLDDQEILLFSSNRPGTLGGLDLWYSVLEDGVFSEPKNLGAKINTADDELTPYYDKDNQMLYFSSSWHFGLGGFDVFKSRGTLSNPGNPENLGYPVNSSANDIYYRPLHAEGALIVSNRVGSITAKNETCCNDIWSIMMLPVEEEILVEKEPDPEVEKFLAVSKVWKEQPGFKLYFHNDEPNPRTRDTVTNLSYAETYLNYSQLKSQYRTIFPNVFSDSLRDIKVFAIEDLFDQHVDKGMKDLQNFTEELHSYLQEGYILHLSVSGHASPLAKTSYNVNLSRRRISSFLNYLNSYKNGILKEYISDSTGKTRLHISIIPSGEYAADSKVSDDYYNPALSVYSPGAALERRIEVQNFSITHPDSSYSAIVAENPIVDLGKIRKGKEHQVEFYISNSGNQALIIEKISGSENARITYDAIEINPGEGRKIMVSYTSPTEKGLNISELTVFSNSFTGPLKLFISSEVLR
ncbi:MAG: DUF1573 domain-containing protein [Cytophagaceae bacterium]